MSASGQREELALLNYLQSHDFHFHFFLQGLEFAESGRKDSWDLLKRNGIQSDMKNA